MGGYSSEVAISLKSGSVVYKHLDKAKFNAYCIHILKEGWFLVESEERFPINKHDFSVEYKNEKLTFDCVFNAIHGAPGENGVILAYFDLLGIKHTSAPFYQMALTFNKRDTLSILRKYDIPTATSIYLNKGETIDVDFITNKVGLPCFVKPNNAGSSFGISKAHTKEDIIPAVEKAYKEDHEILIESFLDGKEVSVGVIEYNNVVKVLPITEIVSENDFFDYEAKYEGKSQEITPARLTEDEEIKVREVAKKAYEVLNMSGFSRSEYIFVDGVPHFLEMNTVPGLTEESILPQQANEAGISLADLFENAIMSSLNSEA